MVAKDLISDTVPPLRTSDSGVKALSWMEIFKISHLPIVNNKEFLGLISDQDIYDLNMADEPIGNHNLSLFSPFVYADQFIYEIIAVVSKLKLTVIPVLDEQKGYLGLITLSDLVQKAATLLSVDNPGGVIVLEMDLRDYSLSQISQIVEGNDAKILSCYVSSPEKSTNINVTLKVNRTDLSSILQTFNRYNYKIKATYMEDAEVEDLLNDRYEEFIRYLNV